MTKVDGRSLRATGRTEQFNFKVSPGLKKQLTDRIGDGTVSLWMEEAILEKMATDGAIKDVADSPTRESNTRRFLCKTTDIGIGLMSDDGPDGTASKDDLSIVIAFGEEEVAKFSLSEVIAHHAKYITWLRDVEYAEATALAYLEIAKAMLVEFALLQGGRK